MFNPINSIFEEQKFFNDEIKEFSKYDIYSKNTSPNQGDIFKTLSFLYSRMKSIELKRNYEKDNNFIYDCVLTTRFDVGHQNGGANKTSHLKFDRNLDMKYVYQAYWNQTNAGASDHWFYSNSKNMDIIGNLYYCINDYIKEDSEYYNLCKTGWPLSNSDDEFSNEMFKKEKRSDKKLTGGKTILINNHCIYKYHLIKNKMWGSKSKFLNKELW